MKSHITAMRYSPLSLARKFAVVLRHRWKSVAPLGQVATFGVGQVPPAAHLASTSDLNPKYATVVA